MTGEGIAKVLGGITSLVWTGLAFYIVWLLRTSITGAVDRLTGVEGWGVKFALSGGEQAMTAAFEIAAKNPKWSAVATEQDCQEALEKAKARRRSTRARKSFGSMTAHPIIATNRACCAASAP